MDENNEIELDGEKDYVLPQDQTGVWIRVNNVSVWVHRTDEGVVVDLWPHQGELDEPVASTYAFFDDVGD
jgi:hypothetical protein